MLNNLRIRLTLIYLGFSFLFVIIIGLGLYLFLTRYFQTTTDRALQYRLVQQLEFLGLPVPPDLAAVKFVWYGNGESTNQPFTIFTPLPTIQSQSIRTPQPGENATEHDSDEDDSGNSSVFPTPAATLSGREGYGSTGHPGEPGEILHDYDGELSSIFFMQVDPEGNLIGADSLVRPPIQPVINPENSPQPGGYTFLTMTDSAGNQIRLLTFTLPQGAPARYFQFGRPIADQMRLMREYLMGLLVLSGISLALMAVGSWVVAGRSIRPAQQALERQQEFVANASHELRTPLTLIRGTAELAERDTRDRKMKTALGEIVQDTDYMSGMVEDLLLLSRIDSGALKFNREPFAIQEVLEEIEIKAKKFLDGKGIRLSAQSEPVSALGDGQRLRQVLWILVDNAAEHSTANGEILLEAAIAGKYLRVSVCDNGRGIPEEHIGHVFDRFYQADDRADRKGAGLGLSLAKSLVEGMGGRIELKSKVGKGTRVNIYLDRA
jgi:signal transduction histidine kinase